MSDRIVFIDDEPLPPITPSRSTMNEHDEHDIARMDAESPAAHLVGDDDPVAEAEARTPNADEAPEA